MSGDDKHKSGQDEGTAASRTSSVSRGESVTGSGGESVSVAETTAWAGEPAADKDEESPASRREEEAARTLRRRR